MLVAFTTASESIGLASGQYGIATPACNVTTSKTISFNFESPDVTAMPAEFIANLYAYQTVAEIGIAYGVPMASAPVANCMCWTASNCFAQGIGPYGSACTMGTATVDSTSPCKTTDMFDVAATFEARLGARPD